MTIVERTEECCVRIDNHGQKIQEASKASRRMLQVHGGVPRKSVDNKEDDLGQTLERFRSGSSAIRIARLPTEPSIYASATNYHAQFCTSRYLRQGDNADKGCWYNVLQTSS
jgi:hypothetical protein